MEKCDLLAVYSDIDKDTLKQNVNCDFRALIKANEETTGVIEDENVVFKDDKTLEYSSELFPNNVTEEHENNDAETHHDTTNSSSLNNETQYEFDLDEI